IHSDLEDLSAKKAEAFSYLGDDEAVMEAFREADLSAPDQPLPADALPYHLAAVASLRLGDEPQARRYWKQAQQCDPSMILAQDNLDDLAKPVGERHAPWAFGFPQWVPHQALRDLARRVETANRRHGE